MNWRVRVVHTTGYRYESPVTQSYNEARLTPRSDRRQNLVVSRVDSIPGRQIPRLEVLGKQGVRPRYGIGGRSAMARSNDQGQ